MSGKTKKTLNFLLLRPAFTQKNITSIGIVALALGVYTIAGGSDLLSPPKMKTNDKFGDVSFETNGMPEVLPGTIPETAVQAEPVDNPDDRESAESLIGIQPSNDESERTKVIDKRGRLFDPDNPDDDGEDSKPLNKDALVQGVDLKSHRDEWMMKRSEKRRIDNLAAIEDRLDMKRSRKKRVPVSTGDPQ